MPFTRILSTIQYTPVLSGEKLDGEERGESDSTDDHHGQRSPRGQSRWSLIVAFLLGALTVGLLLLSLWTLITPKSTPSPADSSCQKPAIRREWRTLSREEKTGYITAVQCLQQTPSRLGLNHSLYHDFGYVHVHVGNDTHYTGSFLAWHRYLIQIYEDALRGSCGYTGHLPYWDWSLDWENLLAAPVFDNDVGFGGDGNSSDPSRSIHGSCVTSGPFSRLEVPFIDRFSWPHCLSRGFARGENLTLFSSPLRPSSIENLLQTDDELTFILNLEDGPHLSIPRTVHGDFSVTGPAEPLFYLHHGQLDRLWWRWQQLHKKYTVAADLDGLIRMGGLAPDIPVRDIIDTESGILCYRY